MSEPVFYTVLVFSAVVSLATGVLSALNGRKNHKKGQNHAFTKIIVETFSGQTETISRSELPDSAVSCLDGALEARRSNGGRPVGAPGAPPSGPIGACH